jgi:hypothetical protein
MRELVEDLKFTDFNNYKSFIFEGLNRYSDFMGALTNVSRLEDYINYHSKNYFSGYYDGHWSLSSAK